MAKLKFKDENNNFIPVVQDVKVNGSSVFDGKDASVELKTVNGQSLAGSGNIEVDSAYSVSATQIGNEVYMSEEDLDYIKQNAPRALDLELDSVPNSNFYLVLERKNMSGLVYATSNYSAGILTSIELEIQYNDTATSGSAFSVATNNFEYVKYTVNQNLTTQQKTNARNNIEALGTGQVKQQTGQSTTDIMSQKGVTDALANKQDNKPDGTHLLVSTDTGKLDLVYIPSTVLGGITNGGTFNGNGVITASSYAPELQGEKIDEVEFGSYPSYYFICSSPYSFAGFDFAVGDWAISLGNGWAKLNATDAVTSVNGKMGQVVLDYDDVGAVKEAWGVDNANKNLVTDASGNVITSDYALGQIIVDYYEELPTNVPETAKASVVNSSSAYTPPVYAELEYYGEVDFILKETPVAPESEGGYINYLKYDASHEEILESSAIDYGAVFGEEATLNIYDNNTGDTWFYNFVEQEDPNTGETLSVGWYQNDPNTGINTTCQYSDIPTFEGYELDVEGYECDQSFLDNILYETTHLAGDYIYTEVQPSTTPKTYYWKYTPSNVQSDWTEDNPLSLAYIKNKPQKGVLNTTNASSLQTNANEVLEGTVNLHKVSKTGQNEDLINFVGIRIPVTGVVGSVDGEIFNGYWGANLNTASGESSHAEGRATTASGNNSHSQNYQTTASGVASHAEGSGTTASSAAAHSEGYNTVASGLRSHSEGSQTNAIGNYSHSEGGSTRAEGEGSHAEGVSCQSTAAYSHSEGYFSYAQGLASHSEGGSNASGEYSHAENISSARGVYSHAEGYRTIASSTSQHVQGKYNAEDINNNYAHIVGNGTADNARSNAHTLDWSGNAWFAGGIRVGGTSWDTGTPIGGGGGGSLPYRKTLTQASQNYAVANNVVTITDSDVSTNTEVALYPADTATETWLENNLSSCILTEATGSFSFSIDNSLPATFSMYYIITEVQ